MARPPDDRTEDDFAREIDAHLNAETDQLIAEGVAPEAARRAAKRTFGNVTIARERFRESRGLAHPEGVWRDIRMAVRSLRRAPAFAAVAVLTLAVGIGANTAVFSLVRPLLLAPLPMDHADDLLWVSNVGRAGLSGATYQVDVFDGLRRAVTTWRDATAYFAFFGYDTHTLGGRAEPERIVMVAVAPRFFDVLGVNVAQGRAFSAEESTPNGPLAVVLTDGFWRRRLGADPDIVGRSLTIDDRPARVAGILPASFDFSSVFTPGTEVDAFYPADLQSMRGWGNTLAIVARLAPGATVAKSRAEVATLIPVLQREHPDWEWGGLDARVAPLRDYVSGPLRRSLVLLWGAVGIVLLIVCVNVSNLLIARATTREKEFAVRLALGAGRQRVLQQLAIEGLVLAALGALAGVPLAFALTAFVKRQVTLAIPLLYRADVNGLALAVTAGVALVTGFIVSLAPGLRLAGEMPSAALKDQARGATAGPRAGWTRSALVVVEVALATVLLIGGGLVGRSFLRALRTDFGFQPANAVALRLDMPGTHDDAARRRTFVEAAGRLREVSGVTAAGFSDALPLDNNRTWTIRTPDARPDLPSPLAYVYVVSPGYFGAMGMSLVAGRDFAIGDTPERGRLVIVSESLARVLFPGRDAVGHDVVIQGGPTRVIGVVRDVRQTRVDESGAAQMYLSCTQSNCGSGRLVVRSSLPADTLVPTVRAALTAFNPDVLVTDAQPLDDFVDRALSPRRFLATLIAAFSICALALATLGIYGVVSFGVSQREKEIGVRMALGATAGTIERWILVQTLRLVGAGVVLGLALSLVLTRVLEAVLYDTSARDAATFATTALVLMAAALVAAYVPARRASHGLAVKSLRS